MRKVPYIIILFIIILILFPSLRYQVFSYLKPETNISKDKDPFYEFENSFFDSLISDPQKYKDKQITICGFVQLDFEHSALYKYDYFKLPEIDTSQAFWLNINPTDSLIFNYQGIEYDLRDVDIKSFYRIFNNKVVEIVGTFNSYNKGHFDLYLGSIENISSIKIYIKTFPGIII